MKSTRQAPGNLFELQALEPRVLLSADLLAMAVVAGEKGPSDKTADEVVLDASETAEMGTKENVVAYDPAAQIDDIFAGMGDSETAADSGAGVATEMTTSEPAAAVEAAVDNSFYDEASITPVSSDESSPVADKVLADPASDDDGLADLVSMLEAFVAGDSEKPATASELPATGTSEKAPAGTEEATAKTLQPVASMGPEAAPADDSTTPSGLGEETTDPMADQLTDTLKSANGPPASDESASVDEPSPTNSTEEENSAEAIVFLGSHPLAVDSAENADQAATAEVEEPVLIQLFPEVPVIPAGVLTIAVGSKLAGSGKIVGNVINLGTVSPGNSPGTQTVDGDFTFTHSGEVLIELGGTVPGTEHDVINISGKASFGGKLTVAILPGFTPAAGQTFDIITYGSSADAFDEFEGIHLGGGLFLQPVFGAGKLTLQVVDVTAAFNTFAVDLFNRLNAIVSDMQPGTEGLLQGLLAGVRQAAAAFANGSPLTHTFTTTAGDVKVSLFVDTNGDFEKLLIGATGINVMAGPGGATATLADDKGVRITNGNLGFVLFNNQTYALDVSGAAAIVGVAGLAFDGTLALRSSTAGAVDESITVGADTVEVKFTAAAPLVLGGSLTLEVATPAVNIEGKFAISVGGAGQIFIGASDVTAFVGNGGVGLSITAGSLALLIAADQTFAFDAAG